MDQQSSVTHAQCWAHTRRYFDKAKDVAPAACAEALALIGELYEHERHIRDHDLLDQAKSDCRAEHSLTVVTTFWRWCDEQLPPQTGAVQPAGQGTQVRHGARGDAGNRIKELKDGLQIDRTSCTSFHANQLRVLMSAGAYVLMKELRLKAKRTSCARAQVSMLRLRLLKIGAIETMPIRNPSAVMPAAPPVRSVCAGVSCPETAATNASSPPS